MEALKNQKSKIKNQKFRQFIHRIAIFSDTRMCLIHHNLTFPPYHILTVSLLFFSWFPTLDLSAQSDLKNLQVAFENSYSMEAKADYSRAIKTIKDVYQENSYEINLRLGGLLYLSGLHIESISYYQKAMKLKPYAIEPKFGSVFPSAALGNWTQVIYQYQEILKIDPQNTLANYRIGLIYYNKQDYTKAEKFLEKVVNLYPFDYDANLLYGWINLKLGKFREAKILFNKVLLHKPKDASALEGLSLIK
jgi:tetratricopeptide (TPR) repeat protein